MDLLEYQGKQFFATFGIPVSDGRGRRHGRRGGRRRRAHRLPGGRQGPGARRRSRQGRRHQARHRRRRGARARRQHPRHGHQGPHRQDRLDRARLRHRRGVLRQLHARPRGQEAPRHAVGRGRRRDRGGGRVENPDAIAKIWIDPVDGLTEERRPRVGRGRQAQPRRPPTARSTSCSKLYTRLHRGRRRPRARSTR